MVRAKNFFRRVLSYRGKDVRLLVGNCFVRGCCLVVRISNRKED